MGRILLVALIAALVGCAPINRKANFAPATVTHSASIATMSLETATSICNTVIPFASRWTVFRTPTDFQIQYI